MGFAQEQIGPCLLINGDMREVLPELDVRADMIMSDPPYRLTSGGNLTGEMGGCFAKDSYDNSGELFDMVEWVEMAPLIYNACLANADAIIMVNDREEPKARLAFEDVGFGFHRLLVWDKVGATPNRWYMPNCEFGLYLWKGRARVIGNPSSKALIRCPQRDVSGDFHPETMPLAERKDHPTEKPEQLMRFWIENSTDLDDLVMDPFMGSGSTIVAAVQSGRRAVGIEKDSRWFDVACARVESAVAQGRSDLFTSAPMSGEQGGLAV